MSAEAINTKAIFYEDLASQLRGLLDGEHDRIANAANTSAFLWQYLDNLNWVGFYFLQSPTELVVGPFQGKPACVRIAVGKGVCGTAVQQKKSIRVEDVHAFPGHIACDAASQSELVVPLIENGVVFGVLDLDSPSLNRFDIEDQKGLELLASVFTSSLASRPQK